MYRCSLGLEVLILQQNGLDSPQSHKSSETPTVSPSSPSTGPTCSGVMISTSSLIGIMAQLPLSRAVSPAKIFPLVARGLGWTVRDQAYGLNISESLAKYDRPTRSWRTSVLLLFGGLEKYSGGLPKSGMTRSGKIYGPLISEHRTKENERGLWPTPLASDFRNRGSKCGKGQWNLSHVLHRAGRLDLQLSPTFREELMGFPTGWTDCEPSATPSSRSKSTRSCGR